MSKFEKGQRVCFVSNEEMQGIVLGDSELMDWIQVQWKDGLGSHHKSRLKLLDEDVLDRIRVKKIEDLKKQLEILQSEHTEYLFKKHGVNEDSDLLDQVKVLREARREIEAIKLIRAKKGWSILESKHFFDRLAKE